MRTPQSIWLNTETCARCWALTHAACAYVTCTCKHTHTDRWYNTPEVLRILVISVSLLRDMSSIRVQSQTATNEDHSRDWWMGSLLQQQQLEARLVKEKACVDIPQIYKCLPGEKWDHKIKTKESVTEGKLQWNLHFPYTLIKVCVVTKHLQTLTWTNWPLTNFSQSNDKSHWMSC